MHCPYTSSRHPQRESHRVGAGGRDLVHHLIHRGGRYIEIRRIVEAKEFNEGDAVDRKLPFPLRLEEIRLLLLTEAATCQRQAESIISNYGALLIASRYSISPTAR
jgi:hypothetical protein